MNDRMYETAAVIIEAECRDKFIGVTDATELMKIAFKVAHRHWMFTNEQDQFKGAIGAVLITLKAGPEFERLRRSVDQLGKLSAMLNALQQGIPVDMERMLEQQREDGIDQATIIPLNKLWSEIRA